MKDSQPETKLAVQKDPKEAEKAAKEDEEQDKAGVMDINDITTVKFLDKGDYQVHILIEEVRELKGNEDSE
jgi:hypothetical protein